MNKLSKIFCLSGLLLCGCATVVDAQAPLELQQLTIRSPLQPTPRSKLTYQVLVAELAGKRNQLDVSLEYYQQLAFSSDDPRLAERATMLALLMKKDTVALNLAKRWVTLAAGSNEARQALVLALLRNNVTDEVTEHLEIIRENAGKDNQQEGYAIITSLLGELEDKQAALQVMRNFRDSHPHSVFAHYHLALLALAADDDKLALSSLDKALSYDSRLVSAHLLRARILMNHNDRETALESLAKAVATVPKNRDLRISYARLLIDSGQLEKARDEFNALLKQDPEDVDSLYVLGRLAAETEQFDLAETYFLDLIKRSNRLNDAYFELGRIEEQRGNYDKAKIWYEHVKGENRYLSAQMRMGVVLAKTGDLRAAEAHFDTLRRGFPQNSIILYIAQADAMRETEHYQEGFDTLDKALNLHPKDRDLLYARALAAEKLGHLDILERDLRAIIAADPKNGQALNALGYTLADRTDRYQEALGYIEQALELLPDDGAVLDSMGWVQYRIGNLDKALGYLRRAYKANPDPEVAAHLSEVLWVSGQKEEAQKIWRESHERHPKSAYLRKIQERFGW